MADSPDSKELLRWFNERDVEYLIVGGYAVMKYTEGHPGVLSHFY